MSDYNRDLDAAGSVLREKQQKGENFWNKVWGLLTAPGNAISTGILGEREPQETGGGVGPAWDTMNKNQRLNTMNPWSDQMPEGSPSSPTPYVGIRPIDQGPMESGGGYLTGVSDRPEGGFVLRMQDELQEPSDNDLMLQQMLIGKGAQIEADGYAGPQTIEALNEYLKSIGVNAQFSYGDEIPPEVMEMLK